MTGPKPPYVCANCGHPRYALVSLRRMTSTQRRCTECNGRLIADKEDK